MGNLESSINLTPITAWLWTVEAGVHREEPRRHEEDMQTPPDGGFELRLFLL